MTFKRAIMIGFVGVVLAAMRGGEAHAHYTYIGTKLVYHSLGCEADIGQIPSSTLGLFLCRTQVATVEILCQNPAGNDVQPGEAATQTELLSAVLVTPDDSVDKKRGRAHVETITSTDSLLNPEFCVNPNWIPIRVIVTSVNALFETYICTAEDDPDTPEDDRCDTSVLESLIVQACELPELYNVQNLPPPGTAYECQIVGEPVHNRNR